MDIPAWMRVRRSAPLEAAPQTVNKEGLTFDEWLDAAEITAIRNDVYHEYEAAWRRGEDPTEYRNPKRFPQRGIKITDNLEGLSGDDRPYYFEIQSDDWDEAARKVIETINGVGYFHFSSLKEALDSGPYGSSKEFVLKHLHWIKDWYEVYEGSKIRDVFERKFR